MKPRTTPVHTDFLGATQAARLVAQVGVAACLAGLADAIEEDFARWPDFEKSARIAHHSPGGVIELMPVSDALDYAFKYVNGHPDNADRDLPTVMAFGALADVATGLPVFLSDLTLATALRTAATSALAARRLARPGCRSMALIGAGSQSEFQALAFTHLLGVERLRIFDIDVHAMRKLVEMGFKLVATGGTQRYFEDKGVPSTKINKVLEGRPHVVDAIKNGEIQLVLNTTETRASQSDSKPIRQTALMQKVPYYTTLPGILAVTKAIAAQKEGRLDVKPLQDYF